MRNFLLFLFISSSLFSFSQSTQLEYKGGINQLKKFIGKTTGGDNPEWGKNYEVDKYYNIKFTIDKNNKLGQNILIVSSQDIDSMPSLYSLIESTKDNWINHTGHDLEIVLPLYFYYDDDTPRKRIDDKYHFAYLHKKDMLVLDPVITIHYPVVH